jgi:hypothetical protein
VDGQQITTIIIALAVCISITGGLFAQAWAARRPRGTASAERLDALEERLARMEQAIDTVSVEVERIGEAHRFTAKLLSDRLASLHRSPERVITPH